jgi:UDP-glucuronate 4-epimerase
MMAWSRPCLPPIFLFTKAILAGEPIDVFNNGDMSRDFTYVDDVTEGIERLMAHIPVADPTWDGDNPDPSRSPSPFRIYNIGNNEPVELMHMISALETCLGRVAEKNFMGMQPGDVSATWADASALMADVGYKPSTTIEHGIEKFVAWYKDYYEV